MCRTRNLNDDKTASMASTLLLSHNLTHKLRLVQIRPDRQILRCRAQKPDTGKLLPNKKYSSSDGRPKTTLEDVFSPGQGVRDDAISAPWEISWQMSERNVQWVDAMRLNLIKRFAAEALQIEEEECERRLELLQDVLPGIGPKLSNMSVKRIADFLRDVNTVPQTLLRLKSIFPEVCFLKSCFFSWTAPGRCG